MKEAKLLACSLLFCLFASLPLASTPGREEDRAEITRVISSVIGWAKDDGHRPGRGQRSLRS